MEPSGRADFQTTRWSIVLHAGAADGAGAGALEQLCTLYWRPLYVFCRARGASPADAEDLTQGFFATLLARGGLRLADPARGRFRSFLLTAFKNHLTDVHRQGAAARRGGGASHLSLDIAGAEAEIAAGFGRDESPEAGYDRRWANDMVQRVTHALREEYSAAGKLDWYECVAGERTGADYVSVARELGTTEEAVKSFAKRVRQRFRLRLEREVSDTVATPAELPEEMAYLARLLRE